MIKNIKSIKIIKEMNFHYFITFLYLKNYTFKMQTTVTPLYIYIIQSDTLFYKCNTKILRISIQYIFKICFTNAFSIKSSFESTCYLLEQADFSADSGSVLLYFKTCEGV